MRKKNGIDREEFLALPVEDIRKIVIEKNKPGVGIFVADGHRRLVMSRTRLSPTSDEFHKEYARFFADSFRESLSIFFDHGLRTLFFPLIGPSVLLRNRKFQEIAVPIAIHEMFGTDECLDFYKRKGVRVKAYGDLSSLEKLDVNHLNMAESVRKAIDKTASYNEHTLFFGFMADNTPGMEMPQHIIDFYKSNKRPPTQQEMVNIYYGENVLPADFIIFSEKFSLRALPPLISSQNAKMYYFPVPGFLGLNTFNYRKILYDLLFLQPKESIAGYSENSLKDAGALEEFYQRHTSTIIGVGMRIGEFWIPEG